MGLTQHGLYVLAGIACGAIMQGVRADIYGERLTALPDTLKRPALPPVKAGAAYKSFTPPSTSQGAPAICSMRLTITNAQVAQNFEAKAYAVYAGLANGAVDVVAWDNFDFGIIPKESNGTFSLAFEHQFRLGEGIIVGTVRTVNGKAPDELGNVTIQATDVKSQAGKDLEGWIGEVEQKGKTHKHNGTDTPKVAYGDLTGAPSSLPANGGNADTVDGLHGADLAKAADLTTLNTTLSNQVKTHTHNGTDAPKVAYANVTGTPTSLPANGGNAATVGGLSPADLVKVADYTAAKVLEMLKTVDGNDSGLDADMVHGMPGNEIMRMGLGKPFIAAGADLNDIQSPGSYSATDDTLVATLRNRPSDWSFQMDVWCPLNDRTCIVQRAITFTSRVFYRHGNTVQGWQPWREVMMQ